MPDDTTDEAPKGAFSKLNAYKNIILALAALATAVGSWFRPQDDTKTIASHEYQEEEITQLSQTDQDLHDKMAALQGYVKAYVESERQKELVEAAEKAAAPRSRSRRAPEPSPVVEPAPIKLPDMGQKPQQFSKKSLEAVMQQRQQVKE